MMCKDMYILYSGTMDVHVTLPSSTWVSDFVSGKWNANQMIQFHWCKWCKVKGIKVGTLEGGLASQNSPLAFKVDSVDEEICSQWRCLSGFC